MADAKTLAALAKYDTPTMCNALEVIDPRWRTRYFTAAPLVCQYPNAKPIVGYARTVQIRAREKSSLTGEAARRRRLDYYDYIESGGPRPSIVVLQDLDEPKGFGAFWGEVQSNIHKGLGALGLVTDGSIRDTHVWARGFQALAGSVGPSHAWVHAVSFGEPVSVHGMEVASGDIVHADRHGAVIVPEAALGEIHKTVKLLVAREKVIIGAAKKKGVTVAKLAKAFADADEIH
jgi:regulator of RNase E activity RraA